MIPGQGRGLDLPVRTAVKTAIIPAVASSDGRSAPHATAVWAGSICQELARPVLGRQAGETGAATGRPLLPELRALARLTFVDVTLWALRAGVVTVIVAGTSGTLLKGRYSAAQWLDLLSSA